MVPGPRSSIRCQSKVTGNPCRYRLGIQRVGREISPIRPRRHCTDKNCRSPKTSHILSGNHHGGGAIDVNGEGCLLTSKSCLLNKNRNPALTQKEIEEYLTEYYNVDKVLWVDEGIAGDDTDGHIDDTARFVGPDTIVAVVEKKPADENYAIFQNNLSVLRGMTDIKGNHFRIVQTPMPAPSFQRATVTCKLCEFPRCKRYCAVPTFRIRTIWQRIEILRREFQGGTWSASTVLISYWGLERCIASVSKNLKLSENK